MFVVHLQESSSEWVKYIMGFFISPYVCKFPSERMCELKKHHKLCIYI